MTNEQKANIYRQLLAKAKKQKAKAENSTLKRAIKIVGGSDAKATQKKCSCEDCTHFDPFFPRMILCQKCGNKRCPHAVNHRYKCTNSNEPNQVGELEDDTTN